MVRETQVPTEPMDPATREFCFGQEDFFIVPPEALSADGLDEEFAAELRRLPLPEGWVALFTRAFCLYWERAEELYRRAPSEYLPPRALHCCIARDSLGARPYFQPIQSASWLFYRSDFDPASSSVEFATYLFFHNERMGWTREVLAAFSQNLGYFLLRSGQELEDFVAGVQRCVRPDADAFRALCTVLDWQVEISHPLLRPRTVALPVEDLRIAPSETRIPASRKTLWRQIERRWEECATRVVSRYLRAYQPTRQSAGKELLAWLDRVRPQVVLCAQRRVLWEPGEGEVSRELRSLLARLHPDVAESLCNDWRVIDERSREFRSKVGIPESFRLGALQLAPGGLCWLHHEFGHIAYDLLEPGMMRLNTPAPPLERWMLAARTVHEWGHWAAQNGWVHVAPENVRRFQTLRAELASLCETMVAESPPTLREALAKEIETLRRDHGSVGQGLAQVAFSRLPDYQANLVARQFVREVEMQTYVRNNVVCLASVMRREALFQRVVRHAYEFQYLRLLRGLPDPWSYFVRVTALDREIWERGFVSEERTRAIFALVGEICSMLRVDIPARR